MGEAALTYVAKTLGDLLIQKVRFLGRVEGEVRRLNDELKRMQGFLEDANEKKAKEAGVSRWISEIREVALDSQDVIEIFLVKVENARRSSSLLRKTVCCPIHVSYVDEVGKAIESIWERLQDIESSRSRYKLENLGGATSMTRPIDEVENLRRLAHWQTDKHLVGMEKEVELLLEKVIWDRKESRLSSATITGMGGIGKSTLARVLYNHRDVVDRFERRCWVVVSSEMRPKEILKELMLQLLKPTEERLKVLEEMEKLEAPNIQEMIHRRLKDTRYFIVVDDLWEDKHWEAIANAFPDEDKGNWLLLTSRNRIITPHNRYVHTMKVLDQTESRKLLVKKANINQNDDGECPEELADTVRQILDRCQGLPLAICVVGGILARLQRKSKAEFEKVLKAMNTYMGTSGKSYIAANVSAILELSYQNLPSELKPCFLCLAFFMEDADIEAKKLVNIWIALGLIQQEGGETMEERAMRYLDELINRNMVLVKKVTKYDEVKRCGMHDLIRDLSIKKAKEEMRFDILRDDGEGTTFESSSKTRHCAIYSTKKWCLYLDQNKHVRSVFIHGGVDYSPSSYWKSFELLRILDLEGCPLKKLPKSICGLIELRYLGLRNTEIKKLPRSIGKLKNLVVLDMQDCIIKIPNVLWKMDSLRHLYAYKVSLDILKLDNLNNIQTLCYIKLDDLEIEQVSLMTGLRKLGIYSDNLSNGSKLFTSLAKMENLVCLKLLWCRSLNMEGLGTLHHLTQLTLADFVRFPTNFPPNLSHLTLYVHYLTLFVNDNGADPMSILEKLPHLLYLKFKLHEIQEMVISDGGFPMLQVFHTSMFGLRNIKMGKGAMSKLKLLDLGDSYHLKSLPEELKAMKNLEKLRINRRMKLKSDVRSHLISNLPSLNLVID